MRDGACVARAQERLDLDCSLAVRRRVRAVRCAVLVRWVRSVCAGLRARGGEAAVRRGGRAVAVHRGARSLVPGELESEGSESWVGCSRGPDDGECLVRRVCDRVTVTEGWLECGVDVWIV